MGRSPVETMFARKVQSVLDRLIPQQAKFKKYFYPGDKVHFKAYKNNITFWEVGTIKQRIGELVYIVQGPEKQPQTTYEPAQEMPLEWNWGITTKYLRRVDLDTPEVFPEVQRSGRKKEIYATTRRQSQEEEVWTVLFFHFSKKKKKKKKKKNLGRGVLWDRNLPASWTLPALYYYVR